MRLSVLDPFVGDLPRLVTPTALEKVRLTYLGTAGFVLEAPDRIIVLDPFLTRPGIWETISAPLVSNMDLISRWIPRAHEVLVGHAHHDHAMDAPAVCSHTGARLIGSRAVCNIGRAAGLPASQLVETQGRETIDCGGHSVRGLPSRHGKVYFNRVTLPGDILVPPKWPARFSQFRHGDVLNWSVHLNGLRIVHVDSAAFIPEELVDQRADVLCLCAIGRRFFPNYVSEMVRLLRPRWVIPCHWDWFFTPLEGPHFMLPGVDLPGMVREIQQAGAQPVVLPIGASQPFG